MRKDIHIGPSLSAGLTIAEENALVGTALPSISGAGSASNQGFAREFSIQAGETQQFSCHGSATVIDIYRLGWYGGVGARLVQAGIVNNPISQPGPATIANTNGATDCTDWDVTAEWEIPADATSGFYVAVYRNSADTARAYIPFIVRRDDRPADIMVKASEATWGLAYNYFNTMASPFTGKSFYGSTGPMTGGIDNRALAASYHRPIITRQGIPQTYWLYAEAPLIRYLERNGFELSYSACIDWRDSPAAPTPAECGVYISSGHDEYWSQGMRDRWYALRDAGKHLLFMSGNEVFWRTRYNDEHNQGGDGHILYCHKDSMTGPGGHSAGLALDPVTWTGTWKDTRAANNATRDSEWNITGTDFRMNGVNYRTMAMSAGAAPTLTPFWRSTTVPGNGINVPEAIGMEGNEMRPQQPVGSRSVLASTTVNINGLRANDNGDVYDGNGDLAWGVIAQRYASGALVVGFGTVTWAWGLDNSHDLAGSATGNRANTAMQQATMNLLADLGAMPATPMGALVTPTPVSLDDYGDIP